MDSIGKSKDKPLKFRTKSCLSELYTVNKNIENYLWIIHCKQKYTENYLLYRHPWNTEISRFNKYDGSIQIIVTIYVQISQSVQLSTRVVFLCSIEKKYSNKRPVQVIGI